MGDLGDEIRRSLRSWPTWAEVAVVLTTAFAIAVFSSAYAFSHPEARIISGDDLARGAVYEVGTAAAICAFLYFRGWTLSRLGIAKLSFKDFVHAGLLYAGMWGLSAACTYGVSALLGETLVPPVSFDQRTIGVGAAVVFSVINATFEETFVCAYVVSVWRGPNLGNAVAVSALLRLSYHLYQGAYAIVSIFPLGVLAAWYFKSQRRLVPLVIAHAILDVFAILILRS